MCGPTLSPLQTTNFLTKLLSHTTPSTGLLYMKHIWTLTMQGGAAIKAATRVPEDFNQLGLPRPVEIVSYCVGGWMALW